MINYLLINITLTCVALVVNHCMKIPHRIRFYIMFTATFAWLIPFAWITIELPKQTMTLLPVQINQLSEPILSNNPNNPSEFPTMTVIYTLLALGLIRFFIDLIAGINQIQKLKLQSKPYLNHGNIRLTQNINGAFVSGYLKPIIWVNEDLIQTDALKSAITHEQQHIKAYDQFWLFITTLVQRLFWFNPLTYLLCMKVKNGIELSCDEACKKILGQRQYQSHLAQLVIVNHHNTHALMNNQIDQNKSFNIHRIEQLNQENTMTKLQTTKLSFILFSALLMSAYSLTTVANNSDIPEITDNQILLELKIQNDDEEPAEFTLITNKGEAAHISTYKHDFGFIAHNIDEVPTQIYTEMIISRIENGSKKEIARPAIVTSNTEWGAFKFHDEDSDFSIKIMVKASSHVDSAVDELDKYIGKNDPLSNIMNIPELPPVPKARKATAVPSVAVPASPPKPISATAPHAAPKPTAAPESPPVPELAPVANKIKG